MRRSSCRLKGTTNNRIVKEEVGDAAEITGNCQAIIEAVERAEQRLTAAVEGMPNPKTLEVS